MITETNMQDEQHLFAEEDFFKYQDASLGQRFLNFLIDSLLMRFTLYYGFAYAFWFVMGALFQEYAIELLTNMGQFTLYALSYLIAGMSYIVYYSFCEKVFRGYTLGKLITGTRAIKETGKELSFKDAFLRSVIRIIPFEALSAFGQAPWHDSWTKTMVIKSR